MDERSHDNMDKEAISSNGQIEHGPDYMTLCSVQFNPENAQPIAGLLNKIVTFEIGQGTRSANIDKDTEDLLDAWQRDFMIASQRKTPSIFEISDSRMDVLREHFDKYAKGKDLSENDRLEGKRTLELIKARFSGSRTVGTTNREPNKFGVGSDTMIDPWFKGRTGKNKFD